MKGLDQEAKQKQYFIDGMYQSSSAISKYMMMCKYNFPLPFIAR